MNFGLWAAVAAMALGGAATAQTIESAQPAAATLVPLPLHIGGRVVRSATAGGPEYRRQWPGSYFETAFQGTAVFFRVGAGDVSLRITMDGGAALPLVKPAPGYYRLAGLGAGSHRVRIDVASESQAGSTLFGGFYGGPGTVATPLQAASRQIEFIGDSHTVGYGNMSPKRDCTTDEVWATTDTSRGIAALTARRYGADYQVNAISGRGIVRNYNGFAADSLPQAYPYMLLDKSVKYDGAGWSPQLIVIALGTNDFSTPLNPGEKWQDRDALHADFEANYARFIEALRARNPHAFFLLWATDLSGGEIESEARKVVEALHRAGEARVAFVPAHGLSFSGCHFHPSVADDAAVSAALAGFVDAHPDIWHGK